MEIQHMKSLKKKKKEGAFCLQKIIVVTNRIIKGHGYFDDQNETCGILRSLGLGIIIENLIWIVTPLDSLHDFDNTLYLSGSWFPFPYNSDSNACS